jgi:hypothetical protein
VETAVELNGWRANVGEWIDFLARSGGQFLSLEEAVETLVPGETGIVESLTRRAPLSNPGTPFIVGEFIQSHTNAETTFTCDTDGRYVAVAIRDVGNDDYVELRDRGDLDNLIRTFTPTTQANQTIYKAITNGQHVVSIHSINMQIWDIDGTSIADIAFAANDFPVDVVFCRGNAVVAYNDTIGGDNVVRVYDLATGVQVGVDFDPGVEIFQLAADEERAYVLHDDTGGDNITAISVGTGLPLWTWNPSGGFTASSARIAATKDGVYAYNGATLVYQVKSIDGVELRSATLADLAATTLFIADEESLFSSDGTDIYEIDRSALVVKKQLTSTMTSGVFLATDGDSLFHVDNTNNLTRLTLARGPRTWVRIDPTFSRTPQLIIPSSY